MKPPVFRVSCASSRRTEHAETRPSYALASVRLKQSARFIPTAPPMLGAEQRDIQNLKNLLQVTD
jgi:hypothetical protein